MMPGALLFVVAVAWFGFGVVASLWPGRFRTLAWVPLQAALGVGLGFGLLSFLMFFWLQAAGRWTPAFNGVLGVCLFATAFWIALRRRQFFVADAPKPAKDDGEIRQILGFYFFLALAFGLVIGVIYFLNNPHGNWDAWSHWNLRARFIFRGGARWTDALGPDYWNPLNYPLMWPTAVAAGWGLLGKESVWVPGLTALFFSTACVLLLVSATARLRGKSQGLLAGILLLGTPFYLTHGASQYSDIPLAFFFLATFVAAALYDHEEPATPRFLALAGIMAGLAAWTKNEGLLFIGCFSLARFGGTWLLRGWRAMFREAIAFAAGLLPVFAVDLYAKTHLYPARTIFETRGVPYDVHKFSDPVRYVKIFRAFGKTLYGFGQWWLSLPILLSVYALWMRFAPGAGARRGGFRVLSVVALMVAGYFGVYLSTPHNLDWHLATSADRLFLCLWPSFLFGFFLLLRSPEEALSAEAACATVPVAEGFKSSCI